MKERLRLPTKEAYAVPEAEKKELAERNKRGMEMVRKILEKSKLGIR